METNELKEIKDVTVTQSGESYFSDQKLIEDREKLRADKNALIDDLMKHVKQCDEERHGLIENMFQSSVKFEIIKSHLFNMLTDAERSINVYDPGFDSIESAKNYIEAATAAKQLGRQGDLIKEVTEWMNSVDSLPY